MSLLGLDLGTSGVRALALDSRGRPLAEASQQTVLLRPQAGQVEMDAEQVLAAAIAVLGHVAHHEAVRADPVDGISVSALGEAVVGVDDHGRAIGPALTGMDRRGVDRAAEVGGVLGPDQVQRITGQPLHPMFSIYKVRPWVEAGVRFRCLSDLITGWLGARPVVDATSAARTGAFDVEQMLWSDALADAARVPVVAWPEVVLPGALIGTLGREAAAATGLTRGIPLVAGAHDQTAGHWGAGGRPDSVSTFSLGSSDCLTVSSTSRPPALLGTGMASYRAAPQLWITLAGTAAGGWALDWWGQTLRIHNAQPVTALVDEVDDDPPHLLVLPYFAGSGTLDNDEGATGAVLGLTLETSRPAVTRAFLEAPGFELARIIDALESRGIDVGAVRATGTGSQSPRTLSMRASAAGISLQPVPGNASARGAALLAGLGIGLFPSLSQLPESVLDLDAAAVPADQHWYAGQRSRYAVLARVLAPLSHGLTARPPTTGQPTQEMRPCNAFDLAPPSA